MRVNVKKIKPYRRELTYKCNSCNHEGKYVDTIGEDTPELEPMHRFNDSDPRTYLLPATIAKINQTHCEHCNSTSLQQSNKYYLGDTEVNEKEYWLYYKKVTNKSMKNDFYQSASPIKILGVIMSDKFEDFISLVQSLLALILILLKVIYRPVIFIAALLFILKLFNII